MYVLESCAGRVNPRGLRGGCGNPHCFACGASAGCTCCGCGAGAG